MLSTNIRAVIADRLGRKVAFLIFITLASIGYVVYLVSPSWPFLFVALALVMAWQSMASPAIFAVIGDSLPRERRAMGFTLQSILKRLPIVIAPIIGGVGIASVGVVRGIHAGLLITLALSAITLLLVQKINVPWPGYKPISRCLATFTAPEASTDPDHHQAREGMTGGDDPHVTNAQRPASHGGNAGSRFR